MNYYISDLHLFHKNVTKEGSNFDNRPFNTMKEMHDVIKKNWNSKVTNADHVYILGDLAWKENEDAIELVSTLRGNKHLILGNHDKATDQRYRQLFVEVTNYKEAKDKMEEREVVQIPLCFLAKSLENMSLCHAVYFCKGWENARGCRIEHDAAVAYGLDIIYEE